MTEEDMAETVACPVCNGTRKVRRGGRQNPCHFCKNRAGNPTGRVTKPKEPDDFSESGSGDRGKPSFLRRLLKGD
jgi:hypothetical protein